MFGPCGSVESIENPRQVLGRDAASIVLDREMGSLRVFRHADPNRPARAAELQGIGNQIDQHLPYCRGVYAKAHLQNSEQGECILAGSDDIKAGLRFGKISARELAQRVHPGLSGIPGCVFGTGTRRPGYSAPS